MSTTETAAPAYGEVFTRRWVVDLLLDLTGYTADIDLAGLTLVEPAIGRGAFLGRIVGRLIASATEHGHRLDELADSLRCYDLQAHNISHCRTIAADLLTEAGCEPSAAELVAKEWVRHADFLLDDDEPRADVVVGNPPYIRIEDLDPDVSRAYRSRWQTMTGRADIYVGFYERSLRILSPGGRLGFICADRWMRNQYGTRLRRLVADSYSMDHAWVMHDVDAFEEQVAAYPAITVIRRKPQESAVVVATSSAFGESSAREISKWSRTDGPSGLTGTGYDAHRLPHWFPGNEMWPAGNPARIALIESLNDRFGLLHDPEKGTRVGIGIATGADGTYVINDPTLIEADRSLPISMGKDLTTGSFIWSGNYLANPWEEDGSLVDLDAYPLLRRHLESASAQLKSRHTAQKSPSRWHRTIDKVDPKLTPLPKLLLRDMGRATNPVLEPGGCYPHHNLYWITSKQWDLEVLGGLLLSRVAQAFIEAYGVRMRGGTLRFQAQYLKRVRVPDPTGLATEVADELRAAFQKRDVRRATDAAASAYGIDLAEYGLT